MRILMIHNYFQRRGGEDESNDQEIQLLKSYNHEVKLYSRHNDEIKDFSAPRKSLLFFEPTWSQKSYREIKRSIQEFKPEIVHFQNFFPLISPSAYYACAEMGVPIVQTLRDYRLLCPIGWFYRNGTVCEECLDHSLWRSISYGCYRDSSTQTASIALMLSAHRALKTWDKINTFVALTEFSRQKFVEGGLPEHKILVRPNFLATDPGFAEIGREYALFVGRLSPEKGIVNLLKAWRNLPDVPLKILGDGPLRSWVEEYVQKHNLKQVEVVGFVPSKGVLEYQKKLAF